MKLAKMLDELGIPKLDEGFDEVYIEELMKGELPDEDIKQLIKMQFEPEGGDSMGSGGDGVPSSDFSDLLQAAAEDDGLKEPSSNETPEDTDLDEMRKFIESSGPAQPTSSSTDFGDLPDLDAELSAPKQTTPSAFPSAPSGFPDTPKQQTPSAFPSAPKQQTTSAFPTAPAGFPAAPKQQTPAGFPAAPKQQTPSAFPAAPKQQTPSAFPAAPSMSSSGAFPAAPKQQTPGGFPAAPKQQTPGGFPAAPSMGSSGVSSAAARPPAANDPAVVTQNVNALFAHYYPTQQPPEETKQYYIRKIVAGQMTIVQVEGEIRMALEKFSKATQAKAEPEPEPEKKKKNRTLFSIEETGQPMTKEEAQAFVDRAYIHFVGGVNKGDLARKPQLVKALVSGEYSKKIVCWTIQRSKEGQKYAETRKARKEKLLKYVQQAAKVVCPNNMPKAREVQIYVELVLDQQMSLDEVEEELKERA